MATPIINLNKRDFEVLLMAHGRPLSTVSIQPSANINLIFMRDDAMSAKLYDNAKIAPGDCVWLKVGSPAMIVTSFPQAEAGVTHTEWFDGNKVCRDCFDTANLTKYDPVIPVINKEYQNV